MQAVNAIGKNTAVRKVVRYALAVGLLLACTAGAAWAQDAKPVRVGGDVQQARLVSTVPPQYPVLARRGHIEGTVKLSAVINKEGKVEKVETLSGHPLLAQSAKDAVKQWRYKPTLLNGEPTEVVTTIEVVFRMGS